MNKLTCAISVCLLALCASAHAQTVVPFNFDNAPPYTPFPLDVMSGGVTAHLSATGQGYSIQSASAVPIVPVGFSGRFIYPSSVFAADLLIGFSQTVTAFSIQYAPQELGCDDSALMRVTAYMGNTYVGTNTTTAPNPGTYPVGTLSCTFAQGFNRVVVHYDHRPPTCSDWGPIFLADNMSITLAPVGTYVALGSGCAGTIPVSHVIALQMPMIGSQFQVSVDNLPMDFAYLITGLSHTTSSLGLLPLNGNAFGMPGCYCYVSQDIIAPVYGSGGVATWQVDLPNVPSLAGVHFYQQALVADPTFGNALHAVMSNAMTGTIGQ